LKKGNDLPPLLPLEGDLTMTLFPTLEARINSSLSSSPLRGEDKVGVR